MRPLRALIACALAAGALGCTASQGAAAAPGVRFTELAVDVTITQEIAWNYASSQWADADDPWTRGSGRQILGLSTPKPQRVQGVLVRGVRGAAPFSLGAPLRAGTVKATVTREGDWQHHDPPPVCEGGGCGEARTHALPQHCGRRTPTGSSVALTWDDGGLWVRPELRLRGLWSDCGPDSGYQTDVTYELAAPTAVLFDRYDGVGRLRTLKRGQRVKLHAELTEPDSCTLPATRAGLFQQCATTAMTVFVRRLK